MPMCAKITYNSDGVHPIPKHIHVAQAIMGGQLFAQTLLFQVLEMSSRISLAFSSSSTTIPRCRRSSICCSTVDAIFIVLLLKKWENPLGAPPNPYYSANMQLVHAGTLFWGKDTIYFHHPMIFLPFFIFFPK